MVLNKKLVVVAGSTGNLGGRIIKYLLQQHANVRALVRHGGDRELVNKLTSIGADVVEVDYQNLSKLTEACSNADCVISALSGLRAVIVDGQSKLLNAAINAGVHKFIPSDYCIDYRNLQAGANRNLDIRREFSEILDKAPIKSTSVLNGMFMDLLTGQAPVILFKQRRIFFWGNGDQKMDFTTIEDTARYTASAALDDHSPRWLTIAGETASMHDIQKIASEAEGNTFKRLRPGGLAAFKIVIGITKTLAPGRTETFPAWQGMQYLYDMLTGLPKFKSLDNDRYGKIHWDKIRDVLARRHQ